MSFLFPALLWIGLPLAAAPVLLHLLNLRRQRRVRWAAMDFLLQSERNNRKWVNLRQWLLLASRIALVALVTLMLARPRFTGELASWFDAAGAHHLIVLDDSFSMSDAGPQSAVWSDALEGVRHIISLAEKGANHRVTVLRTSELVFGDEAIAVSASGRSELIGLADRVTHWRPSQSAARLAPAISAAAHLIDSESETPPSVAYVISDYRARDTDRKEALSNAIAELRERVDSVHLTACADRRQDNLAITQLRFAPGARTSGVELSAEVTVENFGRRAATSVTVKLTQDSQPIPAVEVGEIPPRGSASGSVPIRFHEPGSHWVTAELETDAVEADNVRLLAASLPESRRVIIVDGSPGGAEGTAFATALRPVTLEGSVQTGWEPIRVSAGALADSSELASAAVLMLLDTPRLTADSAEAIKRFSSNGGGVLLGLGPSIDRRNYNRVLLGSGGDALLGFRLDVPTQASPNAGRQGGDLRVTDHPVFKVFSGDRNSFLSLIAVNYYHSLASGADATGEWTKIASLHSGEPLIVEGSPGPGRVIGFLTAVARPPTASQGWSNLSVSPVFPVLVNELAAYLAEPRLAEPQPLVGERWTSVDWGAPISPLRVARMTDRAVAEEAQPESRPSERGFYRATFDDGADPRVIAVNVDTSEGDLSASSPRELRDRFAGTGVSVSTAAELLRTGGDEGDASLFRWLVGVVIGLLLLEQVLAIQASYHSSAAQGRFA